MGFFVVLIIIIVIIVAVNVVKKKKALVEMLISGSYEIFIGMKERLEEKGYSVGEPKFECKNKNDAAGYVDVYSESNKIGRIIFGYGRTCTYSIEAAALHLCADRNNNANLKNFHAVSLDRIGFYLESSVETTEPPEWLEIGADCLIIVCSVDQIQPRNPEWVKEYAHFGSYEYVNVMFRD